MNKKQFFEFYLTELEERIEKGDFVLNESQCEMFLNGLQEDTWKKMMDVEEFQEVDFFSFVTSLYQKMNVEEKELFFGVVQSLLNSPIYMKDHYQLLLKGISITREYLKLENIGNLIQQRKAAKQYSDSFSQLYSRFQAFSSFSGNGDLLKECSSVIASFNQEHQILLGQSRMKVLALSLQYMGR